MYCMPYYEAIVSLSQAIERLEKGQPFLKNIGLDLQDELLFMLEESFPISIEW